MLCVECQRLSAMYRRELCNLCEAAIRTGRRVPVRAANPYRPEDHAGKREHLREAVAAAVRAGEIVQEGQI